MRRTAKISVIIPMHNSASYIGQCIQSVIRQSYQNWEIVVIDDGSTDKSVEICRELSAAENRIHVFCQEHRGVSAVRNQGIEEAAGEFLLFLDSDDAIHTRFMETLIGLAEKYDAEMTMCRYRKVNMDQIERGAQGIDSDERRTVCRIGAEKEAEEWFHIKYTKQLSAIGGKMIRRQAIGDLRFDENLSRGEDTLFLYHLICRQIRIVYLEREWYYYRMHEKNTTNIFEAKDDSSFDCIRSIRNREFDKGRIKFALTWERMLVAQMTNRLIKAKKIKDKNACQHLNRIAVEERQHPLYRKLDICSKLKVVICMRYS